MNKVCRITIGGICSFIAFNACRPPETANVRASLPYADALTAIADVDARLAQAEAELDTAMMASFFDPQYLSVAPDGEMLSSRARKFRIIALRKATDSTDVLGAPWIRRIAPDLILVTRSTRIWGLRHGERVPGETFRVTRLYRLSDGRWRILFQQGSPLSTEHIAGTGPGAPQR